MHLGLLLDSRVVAFAWRTTRFLWHAHSLKSLFFKGLAKTLSFVDTPVRRRPWHPTRAKRTMSAEGGGAAVRPARTQHRRGSRDKEFHRDQRAMLDPRLNIVIDTTFFMNGCNDRATLGLIQNGYGPGWYVRVYAFFQVEGELRVSEEVRIPVAPAWGSPRDVDLPRNMVEPYLDAAWLSGCSAARGDVNNTALLQRVLSLRIHTSSPVVMAIDTEALQHTTL